MCVRSTNTLKLKDLSFFEVDFELETGSHMALQLPFRFAARASAAP